MVQTKRARDQVTNDPYVEGLRQEARRTSRADRVSMSFALRKVASREGYRSWDALVQSRVEAQERRNTSENAGPTHYGSRRGVHTGRIVEVTYKKRRTYVVPPE